MKISKQLFAEEYKNPEGFQTTSTSKLLETGVFCYYKEPGFPFYLPIGKAIISKVEKILEEEAEKLGFDKIDIPLIVRDSVLEAGEEITSTFGEKILKINNDTLKGYHVFTTPEMLMLDLANVALKSHNQLPVRFTYDVEVFRAIKDPDGILKGRQFKTFMGTSIEADKKSLDESLELFGKLSENIFKRLQIPVHRKSHPSNTGNEFFYFCDEGDNLDMPEISKERVHALSLAMSYHYSPAKKITTRFRTKENKNAKVLVGTYGLGTQRTFYSVLNNCRDENGFDLSPEVRPFDIAVMCTCEEDFSLAQNLYEHLRGTGHSVMFDDRKKVNLGDKFKFSDYIGVPIKLVVDKNGITLKGRNGSGLAEQTFSTNSNALEGISNLSKYVELRK